MNIIADSGSLVKHSRHYAGLSEKKVRCCRMAQDAEPRSANTLEEAQGYFSMPRLLRAESAQANGNTFKLVAFVAQETFGWDFSRWVLLTYDEIIYGRRKANGERWGPGSGLPKDESVRRAIKEARELGLLEVRYVEGGTAYGIPLEYWLDSKLTPRWEFFKRIPYSPEEESQPAHILRAEQGALPVQTAHEMRASDTQNVSKRHTKHEQATHNLLAQNSDKAASQEAPGEGIYTSLDTFINTNIDTSAVGAEELREKKKKEQSNESSAQDAAHIPAGQETSETPSNPGSASEENTRLSSFVEENQEAELERMAREAQRERLRAEIQATREKVANYRLSSSVRLRAKERLRTLEWIWRKDFPHDEVG